MRELKFRGKRLDNGEWVYGSLILLDNGRALINPNDGDFSYKHYNGLSFHCNPQPVDPKTVGQYIGLKDSNRKKIYKGDIVRYNERFNQEIKWHFQLLANLKAHIGYSEQTSACSVRIIGNRFENPELLEDK